MKNRKRTAALLTAGLLVLGMGATVGMTANAAGSITVEYAADGDNAHVYKAYAIITGDLSTDDNQTLSNLKWGDDIDSTNLITTLVAKQGDLGISGLTASSTIDDVAKKLAALKEVSKKSELELLAKIIGDSNNHILKTGKGTALAKDDTNKRYKASGLTDGWYLIKDDLNPTAEGSVVSANLLQITKVASDTTTIKPKYSLPTLDKVIYDAADTADPEKELNTASIGDIVTYKLKTVVPNMTGYTKYFFIVNDTLSKGLTYNGDMAVTFDTGTVTALTLDDDGPTGPHAGDFYIEESAYSDTDGTTIKVVFKDFYTKFKSVDAGTPITLTYTATLNNNAVIGVGTDAAGNPNTASLTYSNNPNVTQTPKDEDTPDEPGTGTPTGKTPDDTVKTFTTSILINKVDAANHTTTLNGVSFRLTGTGLKAVLNEEGLYVKDDSADPAYYLLTDGTYTDVAPGTDTTNYPDTAYASTTDKYAFTATANIDTTNPPVKVDTYGVTADGGKLTFKGLGKGDYTLTEVATIDKYNLLLSPVTFSIDYSLNEATGSCTWSYSPELSFTDNNKLTIENSKGSILPSTGGMGTKLFFIVGTVLAIGSGIYLVTKKRMSGIEQ